MLCYFDTPCGIKNLPAEIITGEQSNNAQYNDEDQTVAQVLTRPTPVPLPTQAPWSEDDPRLSLFCGEDWAHANESCQTWCPDGSDDTCPYGELSMQV
jgi:hypothetical protein